MTNRNAAQANHRVDIKLNGTHIQDTIHFYLKAVAVAGSHHCCKEAEKFTAITCPNAIWGTIDLAVVVAALLDRLPD